MGRQRSQVPEEFEARLQRQREDAGAVVLTGGALPG